jgi:hypothetical protein
MTSREPGSAAARLRRVALVSTVMLAGTPLAAPAAARHDPTPPARPAAAAGAVYGGVMSSGYGLMVEVNKSRSQVVRMAAGLRLACTSGGSVGVPDGWSRLRISKGRFRAEFGPEVTRNPDGTSLDAEGSVSGKFNSGFTSVSGTWTLKLTARDAAGAVVDTCDSGEVRWRAKQ